VRKTRSFSKRRAHLCLIDCPLYGDRHLPVTYLIWVKEIDCEACGSRVPLFPRYLLSE
jgi:hypothetical protein